jgi:hypothetical protein
MKFRGILLVVALFSCETPHTELLNNTSVGVLVDVNTGGLIEDKVVEPGVYGQIYPLISW